MAYAKLTCELTLAVTGIPSVTKTCSLTDEAAIRVHAEIAKLLTDTEPPKRTRSPKAGSAEPEPETPDPSV